MKKGFAIIVSVLAFSLMGLGQKPKPEDKIDLVFLSLIDQHKQKDKVSSKKIIPSSKKKKNKSVVLIDPYLEKKYECIIYTKNAKALRDKNITINSELPTFVTAIVSLQQVVQMSLMADVTYIEASKTNLAN